MLWFSHLHFSLAELSLGVPLTLLKNQTVKHLICLLTVPSNITKSVFLSGMLLKVCLNIQAVIEKLVTIRQRFSKEMEMDSLEISISKGMEGSLRCSSGSQLFK